MLLPFAAAPPFSYEIKRQRSAGWIGSTKPDFLVTRKAPAPTNPDQKESPAASIRFARSGDLPWIPRAHIRYDRNDSSDTPSYSQDMVSKSLQTLEWLLEIDSVPHYWRLNVRPISLALINFDTDQILARFVYGERGTYAKAGQEVGRFEVYPGMGRGLTPELLEQVLCSACVVISFGRDLGKPLANRAAPSYDG